MNLSPLFLIIGAKTLGFRGKSQNKSALYSKIFFLEQHWTTIMTSFNNDVPTFDINDFEHISTKEIARGQFVTLSEYTYQDSLQGKKSWEVAGRNYRPDGSDVDCVSTLPVLRRTLKYDCLILVKQYRPALKAFTVELPCGLVDLDEKTEETALRELKEETGYIGTSVKHISPVTALDPGLSDSTMKIVTVEIDGDNALNHYPKQCSVDSVDRIDVIHIPVSELLDRINDYSEQGIIVDSRVYAFAIGMAMGAKLSIPKSKK